MKVLKPQVLTVLVLAGALALTLSGFAQNVNDNRDEVVNVIAAGNPEGKDEILKIFRPADKFESLNYITEMIELKYANSAEVAAYVDEAVALEGGVTATLEYSDPKTEKIRYFIQVVTTAAQMPSVVQLVNTIDLPDMVENTGDPDWEVRMRYRSATEVAAILDALEVNEVFADELTNTVHFEDSESKLQLLDFYDVPPLQVQFDVQVIEVREDDAQNIGLDWDAWKRQGGGEFQYTGGNAQSTRLDWLLSLESAVLVDFLNYTITTGNADVKQRVKINVNNGSTGIISNVRSIPVYDVIRSPGAADYAKDTDRGSEVALAGGQARYEKGLIGDAEEGLVISITPVIGMELVTVDIIIEANTMSGFDELDRPIMSRQTFETNITLENNQILNAGTIERQVEVTTRRGIPVLRDCPVLKYFFSVEQKRIENSKVFVIITPCYCETVAYDARMKGGAGEILRFKDAEVPAYLLREMLNTTEEPILKTQ